MGWQYATQHTHHKRPATNLQSGLAPVHPTDYASHVPQHATSCQTRATACHIMPDTCHLMPHHARHSAHAILQSHVLICEANIARAVLTNCTVFAILCRVPHAPATSDVPYYSSSLNHPPAKRMSPGPFFQLLCFRPLWS